MRTPRRTPLVLGLIVSIQAFLLSACARAGYETPEYTVVSKEGAFEIRDYPSLTIISAPMPHRGADGAFMKLFRFISGKNERSEKISMTTPVLMSGSETGTMSFIVPKAVAAKGAPAPANPELTLSTKPAARYAVLRFSGSSSAAHSKEKATQLAAWVKTKGLRSSGKPTFAYYNPPWTPGFLRRNEVLIPLAAAD